MDITMMLEQCTYRKLTSEAFEAFRNEIPKPVLPGGAMVRLEPWLAKKLHEEPHPNRPKKPREQREIVGALLGGYWHLNGEPILLTTEMTLLDGDNRLESCMTAERPLETVISWGWKQEVFVSIDTGTKRSGGDTLSAAGESNAFALSAAANYDWRLMNKHMHTDETMPHVLIENYIQANPGLKASLSWGDLAGKYIPKGLAVALHYRLSLQDASLAKQFFQEIAHGENINRHDTTYWLRELLDGYRKARKQGDLHLTRIEQAHVAANVLKGWHAVRAGRVRQRADLLWHPERNEPFPELEYAEKQNPRTSRKQKISDPSLLSST